MTEPLRNCDPGDECHTPLDWDAIYAYLALPSGEADPREAEDPADETSPQDGRLRAVLLRAMWGRLMRRGLSLCQTGR